MPGSEPVQALARGLDMLISLAKSEDGLRLNDLAELMQLSPSTTHNLVKTMRLKGFIEKGADGKFRAGPVLHEIAGARGKDLFNEKVQAALKGLSAKFPFAVLTFSEVSGSEISISMRMSPDMPGVLQRPSGKSFNLYSSISGLLHLAFSDDESGAWLKLNSSFAESGKANWGDERKLNEHLKAVKSQGFAENPFHEEGVLRLGAPVFDAKGNLRGALCLFSRCEGKQDGKPLIDALIASAKSVQS